MQIRFYGADGLPVAAVGARGGGPGEFQHLGAATWVADTLVVDDQRQRRVTYIDPSGTVLRTVALPPPFAPSPLSGTSADTTFRFFIAQSATADGNVMGIASVGVGTSAPTGSLPRRILMLAPDGSARFIAEPPSYEDERWAITIEGLSNFVPLALQPQIVFASDGSRFAFLTAEQSRVEGTWSLTVIEADGDTAFSRTYPFRGELIPDAVRGQRDSGDGAGPR